MASRETSTGAHSVLPVSRCVPACWELSMSRSTLRVQRNPYKVTICTLAACPFQRVCTGFTCFTKSQGCTTSKFPSLIQRLNMWSHKHWLWHFQKSLIASSNQKCLSNLESKILYQIHPNSSIPPKETRPTKAKRLPPKATQNELNYHLKPKEMWFLLDFYFVSLMASNLDKWMNLVPIIKF